MFRDMGDIGKKLKGSLLKGSFDKVCALTCRSFAGPHPPPLPLSPFFPEENHHPRIGTRTPLKATPRKNYPLVL